MEIKVMKNVLDANDRVAEQNKKLFAEKGIAVVNMMSSPGSGKTTLLDRTLELLAGELRAAVIEGDVATTMDAERLARHNVPIVQINTGDAGGGCHLDAAMINTALDDIDLSNVDLLFIENVGNLVCPAEFLLGEDLKVVVLSITEGEDKPLKYPVMFQECEWALINKMDLRDALCFDMGILREHLRRVNPKQEVMELSARTGEGFDAWIDRLKELSAKKKGK